MDAERSVRKLLLSKKGIRVTCIKWYLAVDGFENHLEDSQQDLAVDEI